MSDAEQNLEEAYAEEAETSQELDYKALYEESQSKLESLAAHKERLMDEAKKAKAIKRQSQQKELELRRQQEETAAKNGEFEKLWKQTQKELEEERQKYQSYREETKKEKIDVQSMALANELADGPNATLLSTFISKTLNHLADESGSLSEDVISSVKDEFKNNELYSALLRKSKATGGGAPGNMRGAQDKSKLNTEQFRELSDADKVDFMNKVSKGEAEIIK